ncbi:MAG TPA: hypothetical protein ENN88_02040, partial [Candidatus Coatesbacteria bacterium]|nr:hypothetical protein [Candidatus Coatesbacteria bacterium]
MKRKGYIPAVLGVFILAAGCTAPEGQDEVKTPPAADLAPLVRQALLADAALEKAALDFREQNFGLAAGEVAQAQQALRRVARLQLPLAVAAQHVYTADVNLRFADAPGRALAELEAARNFLAQILLETGEAGNPVLAGFLDRLQ